MNRFSFADGRIAALIPCGTREKMNVHLFRLVPGATEMQNGHALSVAVLYE
ncbi:MAG TPA: hypothetical protein VGM50_22520 [Gemmatimonadaceae bacterium]